MAEKKRKSGAGRTKKGTGSQRKTADSVPISEKKGMHPNVKDEIWAVIIIALGVFLVAAFQTHAAGAVGEGLSAFFKGCLGVMAYVLPYYLIIYGILLFARKTIHIGRKSVILLFVILLTAAIMNSARFLDPKALDFSLTGAGQFYTSGSQLEGGGLFGMYTGSLLVKAFGVPGLYILSVLIIVICLLLVINTPISRFFEKAAEKRRERKERAALTAEEDDDLPEVLDFGQAPFVSLAQQEEAKEAEDEEEPKLFGAFKRRKKRVSGDEDTEPEQRDFVQSEKRQPEKRGRVSYESTYVPGRISKGQRNILEYMKDDQLFGEETAQQRFEPAEILEEAALDRDPFHEFSERGFSEHYEVQADQRGDWQQEEGFAKDFGPFGQKEPDHLRDLDTKEGQGPVLLGLDEHAPGQEPPSFLDAKLTGENNRPREHGGASEPAITEYEDDADYGVFDTAAAGQTEGVSESAAVAGTLNSEKLKAEKSDKMTNRQAAEAVLDPQEVNDSKPPAVYKFPPIELLNRGKAPQNKAGVNAVLQAKAMKLEETLKNFNIDAQVTQVIQGPAVTRYEIHPNVGVKVKSIVNLADDIALNLEARSIRIEAPIPGKAAVGIEVPNKENSAVMLRDLLETKEFKGHPSTIAFAAGKDIAGKAVVADIAKMPHLLIAGATGSGKSVCINTLIMSILYKAKPDEVKLIMVDPKVVELSVYNGIPHLMIPVVTDPKKAAGALNWAVAEMTRRYQAFAQYNVRDMKGYNAKVDTLPPDMDGEKPERMPQIVIIVDELADLMMVAPGDVEESICRLAQLARAAGIHLVLATQRPSVNVITGLIKANMPSRIAFSVSSGVDSRTIIDMNGAEKLLGKGDMLFYPSGYQKPARVQGAFVTDKEVQSVVDYLIHHNGDAAYSEEVVNQMTAASVSGPGAASAEGDERDTYFVDAGRLIIDKEKASIGMLQRSFKIGFNRAARIMDQLCEAGVVGGEEGTKPRKILMTMEEFEEHIKENA